MFHRLNFFLNDVLIQFWVTFRFLTFLVFSVRYKCIARWTNRRNTLHCTRWVRRVWRSENIFVLTLCVPNMFDFAWIGSIQCRIGCSYKTVADLQWSNTNSQAKIGSVIQSNKLCRNTALFWRWSVNYKNTIFLSLLKTTVWDCTTLCSIVVRYVWCIYLFVDWWNYGRDGRR